MSDALPWKCCEHCGCPPDERIGHDDTCRYGCNDEKERPASAPFYVTGCDRCGHRGWNVQVRPELPCCPVPLCDRCAELHVSETVVHTRRSAVVADE